MTEVVAPQAPGDPVCGVYLHIPFCLVRCSYCDFNAYAGMDDLIPDYVEALIREIRAAEDPRSISTIFFGGGTPTQLTPRQLGRLVRTVRESFDVSPNAEITVEANPETLDDHTCQGLLEAGFNRISIGVQSLDSRILDALDRVHSAGKARRALIGARRAGFALVGADLIFGTPGESVSSWRRTLETVVESDVDHISAYALTVEEGTPLHVRITRRQADAPDPDDQADKYELTHETLERSGFTRYEVSNWAKDGSWCRHNLGYWRCDEYFGFGAGAHRYLNGIRSWNLRSPRTYVDRAPSVTAGSASADRQIEVTDAAMLGLRLAGGLDRRRFLARWGCDPVDLFGGELGGLVEGGLVEIEESTLRPGKAGFFLNGVLARALL